MQLSGNASGFGDLFLDACTQLLLPDSCLISVSFANGPAGSPINPTRLYHFSTNRNILTLALPELWVLRFRSIKFSSAYAVCLYMTQMPSVLVRSIRS